MSEWIEIGVVIEGQPISIGGLNPWKLGWKTIQSEPALLPHPAHPHQRHKMWVYQIESGGKVVTFAAGELSANVWGFYEAQVQLGAQPEVPEKPGTPVS